MFIDFKYQLIVLKWMFLKQNKRKVPKPEFFTFEEMDTGKKIEEETYNEIKQKNEEFLEDVLKIIQGDYNNWCNISVENTKVKENKKKSQKEREREDENKKKYFEEDDRIETNGDIASKDHNIFSFVSFVKPKRFIPNYTDSVKQYL